ncbi:hypothetical protein IGI04_009075 [Brassica rapa subsp. trilocularis]|uniref:Uncharacterized protein n=1 Tax=Brassica rapa subsp. trilocularis TaxID=1813537 RepID=A0ABQ7MYN2_BRACM|nr:hypothetical protein IGI04_009075 [Brassica rapa subsp. trilocularis]
MIVEEVSDGSVWSREDDIAFERALASYTDESEEKWEKIAADVPGKSVEQIKEHYELLVEDVSRIESGCVPLPDYGSPEGSSGHGGDDGGSGKKGGNGHTGESNQGSKAKSEQERRKGIAWTEDEHRLFLLGLDKYGKGDWRSISRNFVVTRTPTQVASHAQKYFIRLNSMNKDRRRSSIHDITRPPHMYGTPTIGQPGPLVSAVGTPVNLPAPPHLAFGVHTAPVPGAPVNMGQMPYTMPRTPTAHRIFRGKMEVLRQFVQSFRFLSGSGVDHRVLSDVVKACASVSELTSGRALHGCVAKLGHLGCNEVSKSVLNMYAKCRRMDDCKKMFRQMKSVDPVVWNIVLTGLSHSCAHETMRFFKGMLFEDEPKPSSVTFAIVLPVCVRLGNAAYSGKVLHSYIIKMGLEKDTLVGNALVSMYAKSGFVLPDAYTAFDSIADKDVVSWNAFIAGFSENNMKAHALRLFSVMLKEPVEPNYATVANILPVCASMDKSIAYGSGRQIHGYVVQRSWLQTHVNVCNSLVSFYLRVGRIREAASLFMTMGSKDLVSWNVVIAGYASNCEWSRALQLFQKLVHKGDVSPDSVTIVSILPVCAQLTNLTIGKEIHSYILRRAYLLEDTSVGNALISFYARFGDTCAAYWVFSLISKKDIISWNAILDAYADSPRHSQFMNLLHHLFDEAIIPDSVTVLSIVKFCTNVLVVGKVKEVHGYSVKAGLLNDEDEPMIGNALLDAYAKCGNVEDAQRIFQGLSKKRTLVTYNSMLSGFVNSGSQDDAQLLFSEMSTTDLTTWSLMVRIYAESCCPSEAIDVFREIQARGMRPNTVTIMNLLPVCAQIASLHLVRQCHGYIIRGGLGDIRLKGTLLDVYAKCGSLKNAYSVFQLEAHKDLVMFTSMIAGYAVHGMGEEALMIYSRMLDLGIKPDHVFITTLLTACCHAGLIQDGLHIFDSIRTVYGINPTMEQYASVVDLLARRGRLDDAYAFVTEMPVEPNENIWGTLLRACITYNRMDLGRLAANHLLEAESEDIGNYVLISNMYAADGKWEGVKELRKLMKKKEMKKPAGCSWLDVDGKMNVFMSGDSSHPRRNSMFDVLNALLVQMKEPVAF